MAMKVTIDCVVVADPDLAFSQSGKPWLRMRCVSNERKKDSNGQWVDGDATYFDVVTFGKAAETIAESDIGKGSRLTVMGNLTNQEWEDKEGNKRTTLKVMADHIGAELLFTPYRKKESEGSPASNSRPVVDNEAPF